MTTHIDENLVAGILNRGKRQSMRRVAAIQTRDEIKNDPSGETAPTAREEARRPGSAPEEDTVLERPSKASRPVSGPKQCIRTSVLMDQGSVEALENECLRRLRASGRPGSATKRAVVNESIRLALESLASGQTLEVGNDADRTVKVSLAIDLDLFIRAREMTRAAKAGGAPKDSLSMTRLVCGGLALLDAKGRD